MSKNPGLIDALENVRLAQRKSHMELNAYTQTRPYTRPTSLGRYVIFSWSFPYVLSASVP